VENNARKGTEVPLAPEFLGNAAKTSGERYSAVTGISTPTWRPAA
jgi:hypothetical protein